MASTQDAPEDKDKDQRIYHPAEDQAERLPGGVGRGVAAKAPDHFPYMHWRETDLQVV